eukprot:TRINITY_DN5639_c0_g1_i1.p1 TRINITY_DN5639_c0_g1~~TRINITY_DN5639_c0_g1_i1.p1  ORF type:complete len:950 (+),score=78.82 TRINITY_DN5639_c0_g1_i1:46-2850(+)
MARLSENVHMGCLLLLLCLVLFLMPFTTAITPASRIINSELIVLLDGYFNAPDQIRVAESLPLPAPWQLRPSRAPFSDFLLIQVLNASHAADAVRSAHPRVKDAFPQRVHDIKTLEVSSTRKPLDSQLESIADTMNARFLWEQGFNGEGVRVAVFDTGIVESPEQFPNVVERIDWTDEQTNEDLVGHGTFVAGVIAGRGECPGLAPGASIYAFRVFTSARLTYTSWFLDAFNYAIFRNVNILNLSIGGPDFLDQPFVEKVRELSANNIVVVSAIGNEGPISGTLNNPADQPDVIGVGGIDWSSRLSLFSSRGMTTWEFPSGFGRVKPDVLALANHVRGPNLSGGCRLMSGTSVASPVVSGAAALIASTFPAHKRGKILNTASIKQILVESASKIDDSYNIYEQGSGKIDLTQAFRLAQNFVPKLSAIPPALDLHNCPYMWPYCKQPIFAGSMPLIFNVTLLNSGSVRSRISSHPMWLPAEGGEYLNVSFTYSPEMWPYSGWLAVHLSVRSAGSNVRTLVRGTVVLHADVAGSDSSLDIPLSVQIVPTPPKSKRILWDQFHNIRYPSAFVPRDTLEAATDRPFDWQADHPFTNFGDLFTALTSAGYFVDILGIPYSCIDLREYSVLLVVDPEDEFFEQEVRALHAAVSSGDISLIVVADWYDTDLIKSLRFFDENTRQWWVPVTGGSNVPALNDLLGPFGIQLSSRSLRGDFFLGQSLGHFASGTSIAQFPASGLVFRAPLADESLRTGLQDSENRPYILGLFQVKAPTEIATGGRVSVFGDSSCMDSSSRLDSKNCIWLLLDLLRWSSQALLPGWAGSLEKLNATFTSPEAVPARLAGSQLFRFSRVLNRGMECGVLKTQAAVTVPHHRRTHLTVSGFFREDTFIRQTGTTVPFTKSNFESYLAVLFVAFGALAVWGASMVLQRRAVLQDSQLG